MRYWIGIAALLTACGSHSNAPDGDVPDAAARDSASPDATADGATTDGATADAADADGATAADASDLDAGGIADATADGSGPTSDGGTTPVVLATGQNPQGIAVNATYVYWADYGMVSDPGDAAMNGAVMRVPIAGGTPSVVAQSPEPQSVLLTPTVVVFTDATGLVRTAPLEGGPATTIATTSGSPWPPATDGVNVYFGDDDGVKVVPIAGGAVRTLLPAAGHIFTLAVAGTDLVLADFSDGSVSRMPLAGGAVTSLATGQTGPLYPLSDGTNLYWMNSGSMANRASAGVMKLAPSGTATALVQNAQLFRTHAFVYDGAELYTVTEGGGLLRVSPVDGALEVLSGLLGGNGGLATNANDVFWTRIHDILERPK